MKTKAAVLRNIGGPLIIEELEISKLERGQILVKILYSGLCRSNINEINGRKGAEFIPHLTGHEASAVVLEIGEGITKIREGDYVVCSWIGGSGLETKSIKYNSNNGIINSGACSTFSEYAIISESKVICISEKIESDAAALLGCAVPTGAGIIDNEIAIRRDAKIAVFGIGGIGASALMRAATLNLDCTAFDIVPWKLVWAKVKLGVKAVNIAVFDHRNFFDLAVECSGSQLAMEMAFASLKKDGTAIIAGNLEPGKHISIDPFDLVRGKKLQGSWGGKCNIDRDIPFYAKEYLEGRLPVRKLITKVYSLNEINKGIKDLEEGNIIRGVVKF